MNGVDYSENSLVFTCYETPSLSSVSPASAAAGSEEETPLALIGNNLCDPNDAGLIMVRFAQNATGEVVTVPGTYDADSGCIKCNAPAVEAPCEFGLTVALNGEDFSGASVAFCFE